MRIFVSYRSVNRAVVQELVEDLEDMGHDVWYDQELEGGQKWWDNILESVRACEVVVFALTPQSLESRPCQLEYTYANALNKHIVPVLLQAGVNVNLLPVILQERQIIDYVSRDKEAFKTLSAALRSLPAAQPMPSPLPDPPPMPISPLAPLRSQIDSPTLTYEQQAAIFYQLKGYLENPEYAGDARELLNRLADHPSLLASVLKDIESALAEAPAPRPIPQHIPAAPSRPASPPPAAPSEDLEAGERVVREMNITYHKGIWVESKLIVTDRRLIIKPGIMGALVSTGTISLPYAEIAGMKKTLKMMTPAVEFALRDGSVYHISLTKTGGLLYGNREELIALIQEQMG